MSRCRQGTDWEHSQVVALCDELPQVETRENKSQGVRARPGACHTLGKEHHNDDG